MRYRRLGYRYAVVFTSAEPRLFGDPWRAEAAAVQMARPAWRPPADIYETASTITLTVELGGVDPDDLDVLLLEDAVVVEGRRRLAPKEPGVYHTAEIRQGPFRLEALLPASVVPDKVEAHYEQGLLQIKLAKASGR